MDTLVVDHPLVHAAITRMRDETTGRGDFRAAADEVASMLVYEATRDLATATVQVRTPLAPHDGRAVVDPPLIVPLLRAGLGMLASTQGLLPGSETGFIGVARDETTFEPVPYMDSVPPDLSGRDVLLLDPMLATGGSLCHAADLVRGRGARRVTAVCILAAPEGIEAVGARGSVDRLVVGAVDDHLNDDAFIVPGLGDAGDRLFGVR